MDQKLLEKFLKGDSTLDELKKVLAWYSSTEADPTLEAEIEACFQEKYSNSPNNLSWSKKKVFDNVLKEIGKENNISSSITETPSIDTKNKYLQLGGSWMLKVAASILLVLGAVWAIQFQFDQDEELNALASEPTFIHKSTLKGQKLTLTLSDGTLVKLNAGSKISFQENFNQNEQRLVLLEGEAFFDVARDTLRPFVIQANGTETKVLGTSFNVKAYPEEDEVSVAVVTGKVSVDNKENTELRPVFLLPGQMSVCTTGEEGFIKQTTYDYDAEIGWKDGVLHFKNAQFSEITAKLEQWYGKEVIIERKGLFEGFTGTYDNKPLKEVLEGISYVLGFEYEITKEEILIK